MPTTQERTRAHEGHRVLQEIARRRTIATSATR